MVAVGGLDARATLLATAQAALLHEAGDAIASVAAPLLAQLLHQARAAAGLPALLVKRFDRLGQPLILRRARTGTNAPLLPVVVAAGGDFQSAAQRKD